MKTRKQKHQQAPKVLAIQHVRCETVGRIARALKTAGLCARLIRTFKGEKIPGGLGESDGLIIMGGPMGVYEQDRYPFLRREIALIEKALASDQPVLGICLGSQLLATALGARVTPGKQKEIGWFPVRLSESAVTDPLLKRVPHSFVAYHWHGDIFELPRDAVSLASSALTKCQGFRYGKNAYGFLFHMEVTEKIIGDMVRTFAEELRVEGLERSEIMRGAKRHLARLDRIGSEVFRRWAGLTRSRDEVPLAG
jgi:GMP synthase (glutamine-hydrolysing)